jgi:hypothetical protein
MTIQYKFLPDKQYLLELLRPWKLVTFGIGMSWLIYGALFYGISDWDVGVSLIMGGLTYLCAPWSLHVIINAARYRPRGWPLHVIAAFLPALFAVDWAYWLYHKAMGNEMLRWENFKVSSALYFICGAIWYYKGSLRDISTILKRGSK